MWFDMDARPWLFVPALFFLSIGCVLSREDGMVVDTKFDQSEEGTFVTAVAPADEVALPLKAPTKIKAGAYSSILPASGPEGPWSPPFAKVTFSPHAGNPPPFALIEWDLMDLPPERGRYLATFDAVALDVAGDSGAFVVGLLDAEGKSFDSSAAAYYPFVSILNEEIGSAKRKRLEAGVPYRIEILVDTEKNTWSSTVNGEVVREESPFIQKALDQAPAGYRLGKLAYAVSVPGFFACKPGGSLAIKQVTLRKLPAE